MESYMTIDRLKPAFEYPDSAPATPLPSRRAPGLDPASRSAKEPLPSQEDAFRTASGPLVAKNHGGPRNRAVRQNCDFESIRDGTPRQNPSPSRRDPPSPYRDALLTGLPLHTEPSRTRLGRLFSRAPKNTHVKIICS